MHQTGKYWKKYCRTGKDPSNDGNVIRLVFPEVTEERRKALVKDVKKKGEDAKGCSPQCPP